MSAVSLVHGLIALVIVVGVVVIARFEMFCLRDLAATADVELRLLPRHGWLFVIVLWIPIGGFLYLMYGRMR